MTCIEQDCPYGIHHHCLKFLGRKLSKPISSNPLLTLSSFKCSWLNNLSQRDFYKPYIVGKGIKRGAIYKNEHVYCAKCENFVSIYEKDHLLSNCKGFISEGVTKRLKHPWINKIYMNRMFEFSKVEKHNFKVA